MIREAGLTATIVRPWYVLGPGPLVARRWSPLYKLAESFPRLATQRERLGLVTIEQMVNALVRAVENPPLAGQQRIVEVPEIKRARV